MLPKDNALVLIRPAGQISAYVSYASRVLKKRPKAHVTLEAHGKAIGKCITVAEILKRNFPKVVQSNRLQSTATGASAGRDKQVWLVVMLVALVRLSHLLISLSVCHGCVGKWWYCEYVFVVNHLTQN